jgi:branched-chain amino acid transport system substrate-binding protein
MVLQVGALMSAYPAPLLAQTPNPLKIGFLTVLTGPLAAGGQQQEEGAGLFLNERNGMIAGRKVELITQDTGGSPALAKTKTQELVERHKVPVMIGPLATNEALAMDGYIRETKVPLITSRAATAPAAAPKATGTRKTAAASHGLFSG